MNVAVLLALSPTVGCTKADEAASTATGGTASASPSTLLRSNSAPRASAPPLRNSAGKLTVAGFGAVWENIYRARGSENEAAEMKLAAFEAKVGKPAKMEDQDRIWFAVDGED